MKFTLSIHDAALTEKAREHIEHNIDKLKRFLKDMADDLPQLDVVIKKGTNKELFSGTFKLELPKKTLISKFESESLLTGTNKAFDILLKEVKEYKGKHFSSQSSYPKKETIRKTELEETL
jgi:ribosome-associated translation inhibitor RaiA